MTSWLEPQEIELPDEFLKAIGGHPLVAQTLFRRGIRQIEAARAFLDPDAYQESESNELPGMLAASERLIQAVKAEENILVWGDFDVDGQTATSLLVDVLRKLGGDVFYHLPVRASESHGINLPVLRRLVEEEIPGGVQILLTCDTGVSSQDAVEYAAGHGFDVIITDHHELPETLPEAFAIVNPKMLPADHALGALPGVGVAYKVAQSVCSLLGKQGLAEQQLDLVALGIVADLAILTGDTRFLLQRGLAALRTTQRPGLLAIYERMDFSPGGLTEEHISFALAPRMNALGRLGDANPIVDLLTSSDMGKARLIALELEGLNIRRKLLTDQVFQGAMSQIEREPDLLETNAIVLSQEAWPAGVIGIVASRLVEKFNKPVILIATPPGEAGRGSARSVVGVNITSAIAAQKDLLNQFGGHPMAAGLSIAPERIPEFRRRLSRTLETLGALPEAAHQIDGYLDFSELTLEMVADLERLAPFGPANPPLTLASRNLRLLSYATLGREGEHLILTVENDSGIAQRVLWWHGAGWPIPDEHFDLAYSVRAVTYRGLREVQVEWLDFRQVELPEGTAPKPERFDIIDYRLVPHPLAVLKQFLAKEMVVVWAEGDAVRKLATEGVHALNRLDLHPCPTLAIWTAPPGRVEMQEALQKVKPRRVLLFAFHPENEQMADFLSRLAGLVKYAVNNQQGWLNLERLAAASAQSVATVQKGVAWLEKKGLYEVTVEEAASIQIAVNDSHVSSAELTPLGRELGILLDESRAYRNYLIRIPDPKL